MEPWVAWIRRAEHVAELRLAQLNYDVIAEGSLNGHESWPQITHIHGQMKHTTDDIIKSYRTCHGNLHASHMILIDVNMIRTHKDDTDTTTHMHRELQCPVSIGIE